MSEIELKTNDDFTGPLSNLIKITRECEKGGLAPRNMINVLKRPDRDEVLKEIREGLYGKTDIQKEKESQISQEERAKDFGLEKKC